MRDAAVERLAKLISDQSVRSSGGGRQRRTLEINLQMEEGWFSLFLLAVVVYSTIWSVQAANWVDHLNVLSLITLFGLIAGVIAAKQKRFPRLAVHAVVLLFGLLFAYWQTAGAFYGGSTTALWQGFIHWYQVLVNNGSSDDDSIFLFLILALGYILAYTSSWLIYRTRSPWLMIGANAVVLMINLSNLDGGYFVFLVIFLVAALLLLLRFNLHESIKRWRRQGLRYSDELSWDVMQAGAIISICILILSWIMPAGYTDPTISQIWNLNGNPLVYMQNTWNRAISLNGFANPSNHGNFRDTLSLGGNPNLNHELVFTYQTDGDGSQYLQLLSYDQYTTAQGWSVSPSDKLTLKANQFQPSSAQARRLEKQTITIINPPGEQNPYLLGAPDVISVNVASQVVFNSTGSLVAWMGTYGRIPAGAQYKVVSSVSTADIGALRTIPMPADSPQLSPSFDGPPPIGYFDPNIVQVYTQVPNNLDPRIKQLADTIAGRSPTMYDKAVAIENYLRTHYQYNVDIQRPRDQDGVSWFLFNSKNEGFCNYFASAMAIMARELGLPARVVAGYTNGTINNKTHQREAFGSDAHAWTQIYFAGYGWINFEPSATFPTFTRPLPSANINTGGSDPGLPGGAPINNGNHQHDIGDPGGLDSGSAGSVDGGPQWGRIANTTLGGLILLLLLSAIVFGVWWRRLFRRYSFPSQVYGRLCLMASWAGVSLKSSQTPYECVEELALATPGEATVLERVGDIYVRERWADPKSAEHPERSGEIGEMATLWKRLQPRLFLHVFMHPHFLRWLPGQIGSWIGAIVKRRKVRRMAEEDDF